MATAQEVMAEINAVFKTNVLTTASDEKYQVKYLPTGILPVDLLLHGGLPAGRFVEIYGSFSTLKSYIGYRAIAETQRNGGICALIDTERSFDPNWAKAIGVNVDDLLMPDRNDMETGEQAIDMAEALVRTKNVDLVVVDSIAAMLPQTERNKRLHEESNQPGRLAALMSLACRKITAANSKTAILWINQTRMSIGVTFGNPEVTSGGKAMAFYACLAPDTSVLTANYQWVPIQTLRAGDELVGFDEYAESGKKSGRQMRPTTVVGNDRISKPSLRIITDRGTDTVSSLEHLWLVNVSKYPYQHEWGWKQTDELVVGDEIAWFAEPWTDRSQEYAAAYLSGIFDGEGSTNTSMRTRNNSYRGWTVSFTQLPGVVLDKSLHCLDLLGMRYRVSTDKHSGCCVVTIKGNLADRMRFLGTVAPARLIAQLDRDGVSWDGSSIMPRGPHNTEGRPTAIVQSIEDVGVQDVYAIGTTTQTLIADGMFTHNSYRLNCKKTGKITRDIQSWDGTKNTVVKEQVAQKIKISVEKSKLSRPFRDVNLIWDYEKAQLDEVDFLTSYGAENGLITQKGNTWEFGPIKSVGRTNFKKKLAVDTESIQALRDAALASLASEAPEKSDPSDVVAPPVIKRKRGRPKKAV